MAPKGDGRPKYLNNLIILSYILYETDSRLFECHRMAFSLLLPLFYNIIPIKTVCACKCVCIIMYNSRFQSYGTKSIKSHYQAKVAPDRMCFSRTLIDRQTLYHLQCPLRFFRTILHLNFDRLAAC